MEIWVAFYNPSGLTVVAGVAVCGRVVKVMAICVAQSLSLVVLVAVHAVSSLLLSWQLGTIVVSSSLNIHYYKKKPHQILFIVRMG